MKTDNPQRSILLLGKSQFVLDDTAAGLRDLGYTVQTTNEFTLLDDRLAGGDHAIPVPGHIPPQTSTPNGPRSAGRFAAVQVDAAIYALSIAAGQ